MNRQELLERLDRTEAEAMKLMQAPRRSPEEVRRLNLLDEEILSLKSEILMLNIQAKMAA